MARPLLLLLLTSVAAVACIIPPGDMAQIRRLEQDRAAAIASGDTKRLYRLHDLDFRAACPLERLPMPPREAAGSGALREIEIRGVRAWATVDEPGAAERRAFVKDGGRWYLYESAEPCLGASMLRAACCVVQPGVRFRHATRNTQHGIQAPGSAYG